MQSGVLEIVVVTLLFAFQLYDGDQKLNHSQKPIIEIEMMSASTSTEHSTMKYVLPQPSLLHQKKALKNKDESNKKDKFSYLVLDK